MLLLPALFVGVGDGVTGSAQLPCAPWRHVEKPVRCCGGGETAKGAWMSAFPVMNEARPLLPPSPHRRTPWSSPAPGLEAWVQELQANMLQWCDRADFPKALPYIENVMRRHNAAMERSDKRDAKERYQA